MKEREEKLPLSYKLMVTLTTLSSWQPKVVDATFTRGLYKPPQTLIHAPDSHERKNSSSKTMNCSHPWSTEPSILKVTPHWWQKYSGIETHVANPKTWPCD